MQQGNNGGGNGNGNNVTGIERAGDFVTENDVVVGVDGSEVGFAAAEQAAEEAALRGVGLRILQALSWPTASVLSGVAATGTAVEAFYSLAEQSVDEAVARARKVAPEVDVAGAVGLGEVMPLLTEASGSASLLAVGSRGKGAFRGLLLGSVAAHLASHSRCPLLVARGEAEPAGPVVVAVDGSAANEAAIGFAFEEASLRKAGLVTAHVWSEWSVPPVPHHDPGEPYARKPGELRQEEEALLGEALAGFGERYPDVSVERRVEHGRTRERLIELSRGARMLVMGARGLGGFRGMLLGSVSQAVLHHAHCPVVVVPGDKER